MPINAPVALFTATAPGTVPGSGGGVVNFLRADGGWTPAAAAGDSVTYATLAAMRVAPPAAGITLAQLLNRALPYDGGMGVFTWLTGAPVQPIDDDCVVIIPAGSPAMAAWVRQFSGPVNAKWAGAAIGLPDNKTPFLNADKAALNPYLTTLVPAGEAGVVFLPGRIASTYILNTNTALSANWIGTPIDGAGGGGDLRPIINITGNAQVQFNSDIGYLTFTGLIGGFSALLLYGKIRNCNFETDNSQLFSTNIYSTLLQSCVIASGLRINSLAALTNVTFLDCAISSPSIDIINATAIFEDCLFNSYPINTNGGNSGAVFIKNCVLSTAAPVPVTGLVSGVKYIDVDGLIDQTPQAANANPLLNASLSISYRNILNFAPSQILASAAANVSPSQTALVAPVSGTIVQNIGPFAKRLVVPVTYNPTGVAAATLAVALGPTGAPPTIDTNSIPATAVVGQIVSYTLSVPPGWYYSFTVVNAALGAGNTIQ